MNVDYVALIAWLIAAVGGLYLLITWLVCGGIRQQRPRATSFPALLIFAHFLLAAAGLGTWIVYVLTERDDLAWVAFGILLLVILLGSTMFARWGGTDQPNVAAGASKPEAAGSGAPPRGTTARTPVADRQSRATIATASKRTESPAESHFPIVVVAGHGAFAAATLILVLLAALGVGGS